MSEKNIHISLSKEDRRTLTSWQHSDVVSSASANRAHVVLLLDEGLTVKEISKNLGFCRNTLYKWVKRYRIHGTDGLVRNYNKSKIINRKLSENKVKYASTWTY